MSKAPETLSATRTTRCTQKGRASLRMRRHRRGLFEISASRRGARLRRLGTGRCKSEYGVGIRGAFVAAAAPSPAARRTLRTATAESALSPHRSRRAFSQRPAGRPVQSRHLRPARQRRTLPRHSTRTKLRSRFRASGNTARPALGRAVGAQRDPRVSSASRSAPNIPPRTSRSHRSNSPPRRTAAPCAIAAASISRSRSSSGRGASLQMAATRFHGIFQRRLRLQGVRPCPTRPRRRASGWMRKSPVVSAVRIGPVPSGHVPLPASGMSCADPCLHRSGHDGDEAAPE